MLLVVIAFRQRPYFVTAIVNPAAVGFFRRNVLPFVNRVVEEIGMAIEADLHQAAA
jgi:hypothetical protein